MLFNYSPPESPAVQIRLAAKQALLPLPSGGQKLGFEFYIDGLDRTPRDLGPKGILLETDVAVDPAIVERALALGMNPVVEVLLGQPELAAPMRQESAALDAALTAIELDRDAPQAGVAHTGQASARL